MRTLDVTWRAAMAAAVIISAIPSVTFADRITTQDGRVLTGAIVTENSNEVAIKTDVGTLRVKRGDVRNITREDTTAEEVEGDAAFAAGKYANALQLYQAAVGRVPEDSAAVQRLRTKIAQLNSLQQKSASAAMGQQLQQAQAYIAAGQFDNGIAVLEQVKKGVTTDEQTSAISRLIAETHFAKAKSASDSVNLIEMERQLREAINAYEPFYKAHLAYGEMQLRSSATEKQGIESILKGLRFGEGEMTPDERAKYHYMLAKRFFNSNNYEDAAAHFIDSMTGDPKSPQYKEALDLAVQSYIKMGEQNIMSDFQKTIDNLTNALRLNANNEDAHFLLGRIYRDTGQTSKAVESLSRVVELNPSYKAAHHFLALAYIDLFDYDNALKHLDLELKNDPNNYEALVDRAEAQILLAAYDKADADLEQAIKIEPSKWRAYLVRGLLAFVREQYDQAQENLMKVLAIKPDAVEAHIQMGKVLQAQKKNDEAKLWFQNVVQYLEKAPNLSFKYRTLMAEGQTALGEIDLTQESPRQAETRFREALQFMQNFAPAISKIGDVKRRLGSEAPDGPTKTALFKEAEENYLRAIRTNPRNPEFYLSLAILYHKNIKDTQKAISNYRKYLELGGRDTANVNKWIEEAGGGITGDEDSTATIASSGGTTGTVATTTATTTTATTGTAAAPAPITATAGASSGPALPTPAANAAALLPTPATATTTTTAAAGETTK